MPFQVSCPTCASRLKLPDRLYQSRVRGRLAALHCTRCKKEFQIDGRGEPHGNKLPSVPPAADSSALATTPAAVDSAPPAANAAPRMEAAASAATRPALVPRLAPLHDPSPAELKSLFSSDEGWEQPSAALPSPVPPLQASSSSAQLDGEARARARAALRASRPPKPVRARSPAMTPPAAAPASDLRAPAAPEATASSQAPAAGAAPCAQPAQQEHAPSHQEPPSATTPEPSPLRNAAPPPPAHEAPHAVVAVAQSRVRSAPEALAAKPSLTDLSAFLSGETPVTASSALPSAPPAARARIPVKPVLAAACAVGLLACGVWLSTRPGDAPAAPLQARMTALAQPAFALVRTRLQDAHEDAARAARREADERASAAPAVKSRPPRKRWRARRTTAPRAASVERNTPPSSGNAKAAEPAPSRAFDIASANRALSAAAGRARFCGQGGALPKTVLATVRFEPSGRVRVIRVSPRTSRSRASACVAAALRSTRVPAFEGNPVMVSRRVAVSGNARARR